jgi:hypothetical protein
LVAYVGRDDNGETEIVRDGRGGKAAQAAIEEKDDG